MKFKNLLILLFLFNTSLILCNKDKIEVYFYFKKKNTGCFTVGDTYYRFQILLPERLLFKELKKLIIAKLVEKQKIYSDITLPNKSLNNLLFKLYENHERQYIIEDSTLISITIHTEIYVRNIE